MFLKTHATSDEKIAIITDTCCDVPASCSDSHPVYIVPLAINYPDRSYRDRVDITPAQVYARMPEEIPSTSTPTPAVVHQMFDRVLKDGFTHVLCVTISSGLSATFNLFRSVAASYPDLTVKLVDTKSIGIGAGIAVVRATELIDQGLPLEKIVRELSRCVANTHVFFVTDTLEYLYKGGRINKAVYSMGSVLNLRPIITCDEEGKYVVCAKARGRKKSIAKSVELAQACVMPNRPYRVAIAQGDAEKEAADLLHRAPEYFPNAEVIMNGHDISPALVVHTGPGLLGIVVQTIG